MELCHVEMIKLFALMMTKGKSSSGRRHGSSNSPRSLYADRS